MSDTIATYTARLERLSGGGMRAIVMAVARDTAADAERFGRELAGDRMRVRTGNLRRSVGAKVEAVSDGAEVRLRAGGGDRDVKYGRIQEEGGRITPKNGRYLAIPVGPALTSSGVSRYRSPRDVPNLVFLRSKSGQAMLVQASDQRNTRGSLVKGGKAGTVFYILKTSVSIRGKHYLRDALGRAERRLPDLFDARLAVALGGA